MYDMHPTRLTFRSSKRPIAATGLEGSLVQSFADGFATSALVLSRNTLRKILPLGLLGIASMKMTPPVSHLNFDFVAETCCGAKQEPSQLSSGVHALRDERTALRGDIHLLQTLLDLVREHGLRRDFCSDSGLEDDICERHLPGEEVGDADDRDVSDVGMAEEVALELRWGDLVALHLDELLITFGSTVRCSVE